MVERFGAGRCRHQARTFAGRCRQH